MQRHPPICGVGGGDRESLSLLNVNFYDMNMTSSRLMRISLYHTYGSYCGCTRFIYFEYHLIFSIYLFAETFKKKKKKKSRQEGRKRSTGSMGPKTQRARLAQPGQLPFKLASSKVRARLDSSPF